jgi:hypothetical protein
MAGGEEKKRLYDETASLVVNLVINGKITRDEMIFLNNVLDEIIIKNDYPQLIILLRKWLTDKPNEEMNEIIKATLLNLEFDNPRAMQSGLELLEELLSIS